MDPTLEFQFEVCAMVGAAMELGETARGRRRIIPIERGIVTGPKLSGTVLPGGADWQLIRTDGVAEIEARYTIRAHDGALISVVNRGLRHGPPEVMRKLIAGERVDPAAYYFRTAPVFEVAAGPHDWLMRSLFLGVGIREPREVRIQVFAWK
jgi:hypothetical protein